MADYQVTLSVSQALYERAKQIAEKRGVPIEEVLRVELNTDNPKVRAQPSEKTEQAAFQLLSNDALSGFMRSPYHAVVKKRIGVLDERAAQGTITPDESGEHAQLKERRTRLEIRKSWAAKILIERGQKVPEEEATSENNSPL